MAGMDRDAAFFDGITIEVDRITDPRWDRVLPILEEEQVYMCRMMEPLLFPGARVLDIGTGSGVFAIYSAQEKFNCQVTAIDISPRALRFARNNAKINKIKVVDEAPANGEIRFLKQDCADFLKERELKEKDRFDFIFLAPPYNPTCPGFKPALHAEASVLGQESFEKQLSHVRRLLKKDGVCIGNQMLLANDDKHDSFDFPVTLQNNFPGGEFYYRNIIPAPYYPVEKFLEGQYASYLKPELILSPGFDTVRSYINKYSPNKYFALVYYELRFGPNGREEPQDTPFRKKKDEEGSISPPKNWKDRIELHRKIIEHTSLEHSFPAPALFMDIDALPDLSVRQSEDNNISEDWNRSVLSYIEKWLVKTGLLDDKDGLLDMILVDSAPWYITQEARSKLRQEAAVWVSQAKGGFDTAKKILVLYQDNTNRLQRTRIGPFLHRHFTGRNKKDEWRGIQFTVNDCPPSVSVEASTGQRVLLEEMERKLDACEAGPDDYKIVQPGSILNTAFISSTLGEISVDFTNLEHYDNEIQARVDRLRQLVPEWSDPIKIKDEELYPVDLELCHQAMHRRLDRLTNDPGTHLCNHSALIGIPVAFGAHSAESCSVSLPDSYRGGIWLYVRAREEVTRETERYLFDLAALLAMQYEVEYFELAANELRRIGNYEATSAIFHQIPKDYSSLDRLLLKLRNEVKSPNTDLSRIEQLIPSTQALAFSIMQGDAATGSKSYMLLPDEFPDRLDREGCSFELIGDIYSHLVIPYVQQRITCDDVPRCPAFKVDSTELDEELFLQRYPLPKVESFNTFQLKDARDAYIWLVLALRNASFHAYYQTVTQVGEVSQGLIQIVYNKCGCAIEVFNTGNIPTNLSNMRQTGWSRDISVYKREHQSWRVLESCPGEEKYSVWDQEHHMWLTRIVYS